MRPFESSLVTIFKAQVQILLITGSFSPEMFLSHHVQLGWVRQFCPGRRIHSRFFSNGVTRPLFRAAAVSRAMSIKRGKAAQEEEEHGHQRKKTHRFKFSGHRLTPRQSNATLTDKTLF